MSNRPGLILLSKSRQAEGSAFSGITISLHSIYGLGMRKVSPGALGIRSEWPFRMPACALCLGIL